MPPENVGEHVGITICKKSPAKAVLAITATKRQEVASLYAVLAVADFAMLFGGIGESFFLSKKVAKRYERLKDC